MEIVPLLVMMAVFAVASGAVARWKRRRVWLWTLLGALFTIAALIIVAVLPRTRGRAASRNLVDGVDPHSHLRAQAEAERLGRERDEARAEAHRDMSGHIPGGGF